MDAMEGMPVRARRVLVSVNWRDKIYLELAISVSGPGLPHDASNRLFEPFFTIKPDRVGLGLSICRTIVEAHGGRISAANRPGGGATFRILLPVAESEEK
jgi:signal transduction histidine kinase